ncbi:SMI1/KNR4 family protein [Herpetosiphon llansteffanensis]
MPTFSQVRPPATDQQLAKLEARIGYPLPETYRTFLRTTNGGRPNPIVFSIKGKWITEGHVNVFSSVDPTDPHHYIHRDLDIFGDEIPATMLPIGSDPGGNLICISLAGETTGQIFFWDHDTFEDDDPFSWCAPDLPTFLANLAPENLDV